MEHWAKMVWRYKVNRNQINYIREWLNKTVNESNHLANTPSCKSNHIYTGDKTSIRNLNKNNMSWNKGVTSNKKRHLLQVIRLRKISNDGDSTKKWDVLLMCVCVYLLSPRMLFLTKQNNNCNARVPVSDGLLRKYFCIKDLCLHFKDNHRKNPLSWQLCKRVSIKLGKATRSKRQLL